MRSRYAIVALQLYRNMRGAWMAACEAGHLADRTAPNCLFPAAAAGSSWGRLIVVARVM